MNAATYIALRWDGLTLLLPQTELTSVESVLDVRPAALGADDGAPSGWLRAYEQDWPVYSLDGRLHRRLALPPHQRICALMAGIGLALSCEAVIPLYHTLTVTPLPECLRLPHSPLTHVAPWEHDLALVTDSAKLAAWLPHA